MNNNDKTDSFGELTRDLHARNSRVPDDVAERLRTMRQHAVTMIDKPRRTASFWLPAGIVTSAAAVLVTIALVPQPGPDIEGMEPLLVNVAADELAVINELDVLEDLEFLAWMEEEASSAASG